VLAADGSCTLVRPFNGSSDHDRRRGYVLSGSAIDFNPTGSPARMKEGSVKGNKITATTQFGRIPFEIDVAK
jgi:hypothetical protein